MPGFLAVVGRAAPTTHFELVDLAGRVLVPTLEVAVDSTSRKKGLLGRECLPEGVGLLIAPTNAVHTFFMRVAIDIVFVARDGRVVKVRRAVPAWRMAAAWGGYAVVELAAGGADLAGFKLGDRVSVRECEGQ
jgi:uncharacterized membrane protein (UPF0127 family)